MRRIRAWVRRFQNATMSYKGRGLEAVAEHDEAERIVRQHISRARQVRIQ